MRKKKKRKDGLVSGCGKDDGEDHAMLQTAAELTSPVGKEKEGELPEAKGELETTQDEYITSKEDSFVVCVGAFVSLQKSSYAVSLS